MDGLVEHGVDREAVEQIALAGDIPLEIRRARRSIPPFLQERFKQQLQEAQLQGVHALVLHQLGMAQRGDFLLHPRRLNQCRGARGSFEIGNGFDIQVDRIAIKN